jgi:zinc/manganese transport system substrate-binding protein
VPTIVATTSIWANITANVACDGLAEVETIIPLGGDPHSFEPSLRDRETMEDATLIVANGLMLEESLDDTIRAVENDGVTVLRVGDELDPLPIADLHADHDADDGHDHGDSDPHIWFDPVRVSAAVPVIAAALADAGIDPVALDACAAAYQTELTQLDDDVAAIVAPLAVDRRILVTNHDSLEYFADRYDFDVVGSVIPSSSSLAETNAADLDELAGIIEQAGVPAIFAETQHSTSDAQAIADRVGGIEVATLLTGTLGEPETDAGTYVGWLRQNAQTIVDALTTSGGM